MKVPEKVLGRLKVLVAQRQAVDGHINTVVQTVLETLGLEGTYNVDLDTGEISAAEKGPE